MDVADAVVTPASSPIASLPEQYVSSSAGCKGLSPVPAAYDEKKPAEEQQSRLAGVIGPCTPRKPSVAKREIGWLYSSMVLLQSSHAPEPLSPRRSARQLAEMLRREPVDVVNSTALALPAFRLSSLDTPLAPEDEAPEVARARERAARARAAAPARAAAAAAAVAAKLAQNESGCMALASNCKVLPAANREGSVTRKTAAPSPTNQSPASSPDARQRRRVTGKQRGSPYPEVVNMELSHPEVSTPPKRGRKRAAPPPEQVFSGHKTSELDDTKKQRQGYAKVQETVEPTKAGQRGRKQRTPQLQHLLGLGEKERGKFLQGLTLARECRNGNLPRPSKCGLQKRCRWRRLEVK